MTPQELLTIQAAKLAWSRCSALLAAADQEQVQNSCKIFNSLEKEIQKARNHLDRLTVEKDTALFAAQSRRRQKVVAAWDQFETTMEIARSGIPDVNTFMW